MFNPKKLIAIDTETTGLNFWKNDRPFAVGLCDELGESLIFEWDVDPMTRQPKFLQKDLADLQMWLEDPAFEKIFHNANFDVGMLASIGVFVAGTIHDTAIMARVCNNLEMSLQLKDLAWKYLSISKSDETDLQDLVRQCRMRAKTDNRVKKVEQNELVLRMIGELQDENLFSKFLEDLEDEDISLAEEKEADYWLPRFYDPDSLLLAKYLECDIIRTMGLYLMYKEIMERDPVLAATYARELALWPVVHGMIKRGMHINPTKIMEEFAKAKSDMDSHMASLRSYLDEHRCLISGAEFNPGSAPQLVKVLYTPETCGGLGLETSKKTRTGQPSVGKKALRELMHHQFVRDISQFKASRQSITLFYTKYLELMTDDETLHPGLNQAGAKTGRFSCSAPNLQQVGNPKTTLSSVGTASNPRAPFGPRPGYHWYAGDYAQQELRIFASVSANPFLLQEIAAGHDPNNSLTNRAWGGKGNPKAIEAAVIAMDLHLDVPTNQAVAVLWSEIGWKAGLGGRSLMAQLAAEEWLADFDYDIVLAEKSLGRGNSRGRGKAVFFAKLYGGGPGSVVDLLYCTLDEAKQLLRDLDNSMPEINQYMGHMIRSSRLDGFIINPYGRKIRIEPDFAYRSVNYMVQSCAADMVKDALVRSDQYLKDIGADAHLIMTIHDEIVYEIKEEEATPELLDKLTEIMCDTEGRLIVPVGVEFKRIRESWAVKEPL